MMTYLTGADWISLRSWRILCFYLLFFRTMYLLVDRVARSDGKNIWFEVMTYGPSALP